MENTKQQWDVFFEGTMKKRLQWGERDWILCQTAFKAQHRAKQKLEKTFFPFVEIMCHGTINNTQLFCVINLRKKHLNTRENI